VRDASRDVVENRLNTLLTSYLMGSLDIMRIRGSDSCEFVGVGTAVEVAESYNSSKAQDLVSCVKYRHASHDTREKEENGNVLTSVQCLVLHRGQVICQQAFLMLMLE
jgi:hypothetical protein